ncbi:MAG: septum formation initiator family protein [Gemmatimonadaceae bacterium]
MTGRLIWGALILGALVFALLGGEYSTFDIMRQHRRINELTVGSDSLARIVDSLARTEKLVRTDTATQLRIAREVYGLVRGDEVLYRFYTDSTKASKP